MYSEHLACDICGDRVSEGFVSQDAELPDQIFARTSQAVCFHSITVSFTAENRFKSSCPNCSSWYQIADPIVSSLSE